MVNKIKKINICGKINLGKNLQVYRNLNSGKKFLLNDKSIII